MKISPADECILRSLAERQARIAALPVQQERAREWRRLDARKPGRPLVWINEICWNEMNVNDELTPRCENHFCRGIEWGLRALLYQWDHLPADMIVDPVIHSPLAIRDTGFGIGEDVRIVRTDPTSDVVSREFHRQIRDERDLEKIRIPELSLDAEATERTFATLSDLFGDILPVQKVGVVHSWFAPWDELIRWWGVQDAMTDLVDRPELVHAAMDRLVGAYLARLDQWQKLNLLSLTPGNYRVGSGGLGYADDIPAPGFHPARVRPRDQWGCATAQIFSDVSPKMHEEFALRYELRWLEHFGINYYGCCEPLHTKLDILAAVPRLRKVSMSPRADVDAMVRRAGDRYVLSHKPNPAIFAPDAWNPDEARRALREVLDKTQGCVVEIIMKDISTVRYEPQRLWEWARIAVEEAARA